MIQSSLLYASRVAMNAILLIAAVYCVLCFVPFTNQNLIQGDMLEWLAAFVRTIPVFYTCAAVLWFATLHPRFRVSKPAAVIIVSGLTGFGVWLWVRKPLAALGMEESTLVTGRAFLLAMIGFGLVDLIDSLRSIRWSPSGRGEPIRLTISLVGAALGIVAIFLALGFHRVPADALAPAGARVVIVEAFWTQLMVAGIALCVLLSIRAIGAYFPMTTLAESAILAGVSCWALATLVVTTVFTPLAFEGREATGFATLLAAGIVLAIYGLGSRNRSQRDSPEVAAGTDLLVTGIGLPAGGRKWIYVVVGAVGVSGLSAAELALASFDWDFLLQKLIAVAVWILLAGCLYRIIGPISTRSDLTIAGLAIALATLGGFATLPAQVARFAPTSDSEQAVDTWRGFDAAYRIAHDAIAPKPSGSIEEIYSFLRANTNISRARKTEPVDFNLVDAPLAPTEGFKPNIFIIVVDSLRRDYAAPLNPDVTFTPNIAAVAQEGVSFDNAFSHYGASGLAEPSIWLGGSMLHKQYITPFYPMNALQKLIDVEGYRVFLSDDPILEAITKDGPNVTRLADAGGNEDLCKQLEFLRQNVERLRPDERPIFAYLQPLNIHISSINREGANIPSGESYPGFNDSYAWRIRRMDGCIGQFVSFLREKDLWDTSVFVVTSDHGDSLGEGGRWGHAYNVTPEVLRVPLVVKVPEPYRSTLRADPSRLVFTTDLTPSLYVLLGHGPIVNDEMFGRPLFTESLDEQEPYMRDDYLVVSSYGPVYGVLSKEGRELFIADSVNFRDSFWEIPSTGKPKERRPSFDQTSEAYMRLRAHVERVADFYHFDYEQ